MEFQPTFNFWGVLIHICQLDKSQEDQRTTQNHETKCS